MCLRAAIGKIVGSLGARRWTGNLSDVTRFQMQSQLVLVLKLTAIRARNVAPVTVPHVKFVTFVIRDIAHKCGLVGNLVAQRGFSTFSDILQRPICLTAPAKKRHSSQYHAAMQ